MKLGQNQKGYLYFYRNRKQDDLLLKFSDLHMLCEALKAPTYLLQSIFFFNQSYVHRYLKTEYPQLQSNDVVFSIKPFFISAGTDCMILHRQYSQCPRKFRPGRTILKLVGTNNSKAINVKKRGKIIITLHTFRGTTENLSQARPPDHR